MRFRNKTILLSAVLLSPTLVFPFEIIPIESGAFIQQGSGIKIQKVTKTYPLAVQGDVKCGKPHHMVRFKLNQSYAGLSFSVLGKKMTEVKISWDNPKLVVMPYAETKKTIVFPHAGGVANLYVNAYRPVSGFFYIKDSQGNTLSTCPYSFLPAKKYRQSLSFNIGESESTSNNISSSTDSASESVSINYRVSPKSTVPEGANWSFNIGVSQYESSSDTKNVHSSFSINW